MGGSSYVIDASLGMIGSPAIIGAGIPVATGAGMTARLRGEDRIAMCFFGDGACNIGAFHEALNMAQLWRSQVVFLIENNQYGEYTPFRGLHRPAAGGPHRPPGHGVRHGAHRRGRPGRGRRARGRGAGPGEGRWPVTARR